MIPIIKKVHLIENRQQRFCKFCIKNKFLRMLPKNHNTTLNEALIQWQLVRGASELKLIVEELSNIKFILHLLNLYY